MAKRRRARTTAEASRRQTGDVFVGDVVRAWRELHCASSEERARVAEVLGFDYALSVAAAKKASSGAVPSSPAADRTAPVVKAPRVVSELPVAPVPIPLAPVAEDAPTKRRTGGPAWLESVQQLGAERAEHLDARPPYRSLFTPTWARALVSAACATVSDDGPLDIDRLIEQASKGEALTALPRTRQFSLVRGMQVLVDIAENLLPFDRDARDLVRQLLLVVGSDRSRVLYFADCPTLGCGAGGRATWDERYQPPAPGTPIVVISDLGIARGSAGRGGATADMWLAFLAIALSHDCPVVVFNPYPIERWPAAVRTLVRAVPWDRRTTAAMIHFEARTGPARG